MYVFQRVRRPETPEIESIHLSLDPRGPGAIFKVISLPLLLGSYLGHYKSRAELLSPFSPLNKKQAFQFFRHLLHYHLHV